MLEAAEMEMGPTKPKVTNYHKSDEGNQQFQERSHQDTKGESPASYSR